MLAENKSSKKHKFNRPFGVGLDYLLFKIYSTMRPVYSHHSSFEFVCIAFKMFWDLRLVTFDWWNISFDGQAQCGRNGAVHHPPAIVPFITLKIHLKSTKKYNAKSISRNNSPIVIIYYYFVVSFVCTPPLHLYRVHSLLLLC